MPVIHESFFSLSEKLTVKVCAARENYRHMYYYNLDTNSGWHHVTDNGFQHGQYMTMVSLTPYTAFMMGAYSDYYTTSVENFWVYNQENYKFQSHKRFVTNEHSWGYWTTASKKFRIFNSCRAERSYAAVGWGGTDWVKYKHTRYDK